MTTEGINRKLAAILQTDVVGYSRLMSEDEDATLRILTSYIDRISYLIKHNRGNVVKTTGDGVLAEFASAVDAVKCSVEIQQEIEHRNAELIESRRMEFRIGIHVGDIIEQNGDIFGDGVNIAARVEGLADPGSIYITRNVYDQVKRKLPYSYEFRGERKVKNIDEPVPVYRVFMDSETSEKAIGKKAHGGISGKRNIAIILIVIITGLLVWRFYPKERVEIEPDTIESKQTPVTPDVKEAPKTIAVLPFDNLSSDPEQEYFADGLTEEIINSLTQISHLGVTGRTSSFTFKGSNKKTQEIANELGVDHILEGSVRKVGNRLRITAQLIRAVDDLHIWSETYDRELKDILEIQEDIANNVADKLKLTIEALTRLGGTENIEAYELYLIGQGQFQIGVGYVDRSLESINAAISLDPEFALAWALKTLIHYYILIFGPVNQADAEQDAALSAALKAIELEPNLADGYNSLGFIQSSRGEFIVAESSYNKGLELANDTFSFIYEHYWVVGYFEKAHEILEEMVRKDPLNPELRGKYLSALGLLGNMQLAEEEYARGKALFGDSWVWGDVNLFKLCLGTDPSISRDLIAKINPDFEALIQHVESPKDGLAELRRIYDGIPASKDFFDISMLAAYFGDLEFSMNAMEKGLGIDSYGLQCVWYPVMKEVRQTPRFKKLIREIGLVDYWNQFGWPDMCHPMDNGDFECD